MHPSRRPRAGQHRRVRHHARSADSYAMFNLLTGPELFERVEAALPEHRERLFPPTETLSMFVAQVLSADGSCQHAVNVAMTKPKRPDWMSPWEYEQVPATLTVRELHVGGKLLVTTLLCPKDTPKNVLKVLYRQRWNVELDLRNIKTTLGMEHLRCKTPEMAEKELWVYLLAYNLIRLRMAQAALLADQIPRQLSFKHTVQIWLAWQQSGSDGCDACSMQALLVLIAEPRVGLRPGRIEPRTVKRRPQPFPLLTNPRQEVREEVRQNGHPKKQR